MEEVPLLPKIYFRIFVSPDADISNERINWDLYIARRILKIQTWFIRNKEQGLNYFTLPKKYKFSDIVCRLSGKTEKELADYDPGTQKFKGDGRIINVYYLGGDAAGACEATGLSNNEATKGDFPILGSIYLSNNNTDEGKYLFSHELVHILFSRLVTTNEEGGNVRYDIIQDNPIEHDRDGHVTDVNNLMNRTTPVPTPFIEATRQAIRQGTPLPEIPQDLLTEKQREKALESQFVFK